MSGAIGLHKDGIQCVSSRVEVPMLSVFLPVLNVVVIVQP
jgi:hypothetical protein